MSDSIEIVHPNVERYLASLLPERPSIFHEIEAHAQIHHVPIIGPVEGHFLYLLACSNGAHRVLELGTATGYSCLWLARAVGSNGGQVTTIEANAERARLARENIARADTNQSVQVIEGEALETISTLSGPYDFIFVDILRGVSDPDFAPSILTTCVPLLASGGIMAADNALAMGQVMGKSAAPDIIGLQRFIEDATNHPDLETMIIPLRDGILVSRKK